MAFLLAEPSESVHKIGALDETETDDGEWTRKTFMVFMSNSTIYVRNLIYTFIYFSTVTVYSNAK